MILSREEQQAVLIVTSGMFNSGHVTSLNITANSIPESLFSKCLSGL